jgi:hypothetical protein
MEKSVGAFLAALLLIGIGSAGVAAYRGVFYVTGSQFYEACWERQAKEKKVGGFEEVEADNPSQAVLWASCTPIMLGSMDKAGFALGSSAANAQADVKALASACPDAHAEMPMLPNYWYGVIVDAIEKNRGPSLIDRVAPAGWLVERAAKARWPRCIDAARPYLAKARKDATPVTQR